jgi:hypothetical protein
MITPVICSFAALQLQNQVIKTEARFYLEWLLRLDPPLLQRIDAWFWLSEVQTDEQAQRGYLEQILVMDPSEGRARRKLAILDGKLDPTEIVDPDQLNTAPQTMYAAHLSSASPARSVVGG